MTKHNHNTKRTAKTGDLPLSPAMEKQGPALWTFSTSLDNSVKYKVESNYHQSSETRDTALLISGGNQEAEVHRQETTGTDTGPASWKNTFPLWTNSTKGHHEPC